MAEEKLNLKLLYGLAVNIIYQVMGARKVKGPIAVMNISDIRNADTPKEKLGLFSQHSLVFKYFTQRFIYNCHLSRINLIETEPDSS